MSWFRFALTSLFLSALLLRGEVEDRREIQRILDCGALNRHSAPALDWENAFGVRQRGVKARQRFLQEVVVPTTRTAELVHLETRIQFLTLDVAVADEYEVLKGQTDGPKGPILPDRHIRTTYVFQRLRGRWSLVLQRIADLRE